MHELFVIKYGCETTIPYNRFSITCFGHCYIDSLESIFVGSAVFCITNNVIEVILVDVHICKHLSIRTKRTNSQSQFREIVNSN